MTYIAIHLSSSKRASRHGFLTEEAAWNWIAQYGVCKECKKSDMHVSTTSCGAEWDVITNLEWNESS